jgi:roadblock/LC7 domain-containing protein
VPLRGKRGEREVGGKLAEYSGEGSFDLPAMATRLCPAVNNDRGIIAAGSHAVYKLKSEKTTDHAAFSGTFRESNTV